MTFPILASLLVRLVVLLPFQLLRLSLATPSRWTPFFFSFCFRCLVALLSFPTRRSSDLARGGTPRAETRDPRQRVPGPSDRDRKSTRLNSSHPSTSYAVFCLKKKNSNWRRAYAA